MAAGKHGVLATSNGSDIDSPWAFGVQVAHLRNERWGGEILVDIAPTFRMADATIGDTPSLYSYMANAIRAFPLGAGRMAHPYVSGGLGVIQLRAPILNVPGVVDSGTTTSNRARLGGNLGGGAIVVFQHIGIRGDVRYYRASNTDDLDQLRANPTPDNVTTALLAGLRYWRSGVGVSFRW
jgi:hypothetical protein